ncbi:hypothetical protein HELRODRAFT_186317 [Helobdella robusta]|uniref:Sialin n=1 Tax=Helobdella robusta TaxID=6412 RepID=T1FNY5_HELRO|nr:hypothetical protein HELRODRAFT_186317 [Helobdella robusta]ESO12399.1 hypothetical protein HELRODRAFT_186317 [Helobdella robusta]
MAFLTMINLYCMRVNLNIAIVAMINHTYVEASMQVDGAFNWGIGLQGIILGSFFYGYICTQFFGGLMAQKFGSKRLLLAAVGVNSILCLATPILTKLAGAPMLIIVRILQGIFQGITFPSTHCLISKWAPPLERSKMITFAYAGCQLGTVLANPICGILAFYSWESIFYLFGSLGLAFSVAWFFLIYDDPNLHPRINPSEKEYIQTALGSTKKTKPVALKDLPWKSIFTSIRVYATASAHFANNWGFYTMLTCLPLFFSKILKFDIKSNGAIAALPYLACWFFMVSSGFTADLLITKKILSTTKVRKIANVIGLMGPAVFFLGMGYIECNNALAVLCVVVAVGLSGVSWAGWSVNHLDLAPIYAGTLMGLTNTFATVPGFVGPAVASAFTAAGHTRAAWRNVFYVAAAVNAFGSIFFFIFGSGQKQPWAEPKEQVTEEKV